MNIDWSSIAIAIIISAFAGCTAFQSKLSAEYAMVELLFEHEQERKKAAEAD